METKYKNIAGAKYLIKRLNAHDPLMMDMDGWVDFEKKILYISNSPSTAYYTTEHIIEHEAIHALLYERGIRDLDDNFEHVLVEAFVDYIHTDKK